LGRTNPVDPWVRGRRRLRFPTDVSVTENVTVGTILGGATLGPTKSPHGEACNAEVVVLPGLRLQKWLERPALFLI
jgi:hypothetical protein